MRISAQKDTSPLTFKDFQEAVSWILRGGYRLRLRLDGVVEVCHSLPGGRPVTQEILDALEPFYREFKHRLKKPRGWPRNVELPKWCQIWPSASRSRGQGLRNARNAASRLRFWWIFTSGMSGVAHNAEQWRNRA